MMKFQYVIFVPWSEYATIQYSDLGELDNVKLVSSPFEKGNWGKFLFLIYKIHFLSRFSKYIPFKFLWNRYLFNEKGLEDSDNLCFVFFISDLHVHRFLFKSLKKHYNCSKFIMYLEDTVASRKNFDFNTLNNVFDVVLSYDKGDCEKYGFTYYPTPYSRKIIQIAEKLDRSDLFFCGLAKDRYSIINNIFTKCNENNIRCDFNLVNLPFNATRIDGIHYYTNQLTYTEYLKHLFKTSCILDINQQGANGYTIRIWEALVYGKKLITNNKNITNEAFYDNKQFCYIEHPSDLDVSFITKDCHIEPRFIEELSPKRMIAFIDAELKKTDMKVLMIGPLPKDVGGTYTTGICKVVYELSRQKFEGTELFISSTNITQKSARRISEYKNQYNGYQWLLFDVIKDFIFHSIRTIKELSYYKKNSQASIFRNYFFKTNIRRHIKRVNPDLIHVHTTETLPTFFANEKNVPVICTMHGVFYRGLEGQERLGKFLKACVECSNYFTGLTLECEQLMKKHFSIPADKLFIIPNGVNTSIYYYSKEQREVVRRENNVNDEIVFITVASIQERKGQLRFIKLLEKLELDYRYWILGDGPDKQIILDYCKNAGISGKVTCFGSIDSNELYKYYSAADIYAHASTMEGQALCEMEAYATGIRTIVNNEIKDTIVTDVNNIDIYYILDFDHIEKKSLIDWIFKGNQSRQSRDDMSWAVIAEKYNELYKRIYNRKNV